MIFVGSRPIPFLHFEALVYPINRYGDDIRAGKLGKSETLFTLGSFKPLLPSELRDDMVSRGFFFSEQSTSTNKKNLLFPVQVIDKLS